MRYSLATAIVDLEDNPISETGQPDGRNWTLESVLLRTALFAAPSYPMSADDKRRGFRIAKDIKAATGPYIELTAEDVALLKATAGVMWSPLMLGRLEEILENPLSKPVSDIPIEKPVP